MNVTGVVRSATSPANVPVVEVGVVVTVVAGTAVVVVMAVAGAVKAVDVGMVQASSARPTALTQVRERSFRRNSYSLLSYIYQYSAECSGQVRRHICSVLI